MVPTGREVELSGRVGDEGGDILGGGEDRPYIGEKGRSREKSSFSSRGCTKIRATPATRGEGHERPAAGGRDPGSARTARTSEPRGGKCQSVCAATCSSTLSFSLLPADPPPSAERAARDQPARDKRDHDGLVIKTVTIVTRRRTPSFLDTRKGLQYDWG